MRKAKKAAAGTWQLSFSPVLRYNALFCVLVWLVFVICGMLVSFRQTQSAAFAALSDMENQVSYRIEHSTLLLEALADLPLMYDPDAPAESKIELLSRTAPYFGYMMMRYINADMEIYNENGERASVASRRYIQTLFATEKPQVTDSLPAGEDSGTLSYTIAVPVRDPEGRMTGALTSMIYFDEMVERLQHAATAYDVNLTLIGAGGQIMSSTVYGSVYGEQFVDQVRNLPLFGTTADRMEEQLLAGQTGTGWALHNRKLFFIGYQRVAGSGWSLACTVDFGRVFARLHGILLGGGVVLLLLMCGLAFLVRRDLRKQRKIVDMLLDSVGELEKKIYQNERPGSLDFNEIIRLTSNGLSDGLTGVVTRTVFLNQAEARLRQVSQARLVSLCFVDLDNLKHLNDTYGHATGDVALKTVGYILREYEKRYDGVVGRYGGDEFVMLLTDLDNEAELRSIMEELVLRLHTEIGADGANIPTQCSIGVAVWDHAADLEQLLADADEALYFVKQNGKGYYKIYQD